MVKFLIPFIVLAMTCGCASAKPSIEPKQIAARLSPAQQQQIQVTVLALNPITVPPAIFIIAETPDLSLPKSQWKEAWRGNGASATIYDTNSPQMFYTSRIEIPSN